jgi:N-hydroxyarylamine O-acetyltransferase
VAIGAGIVSVSSTRLDEFLERIGYLGPVEPNLATLAGIQKAHLLNVPFENLSIFPLGQAIVLTPAALFEKIVRRRRGGFCYELNGLLAIMLTEIGFGVELGCGLWPAEDEEVGPLFDHLVLTITVPDERDRWLVDVGAGRQSPLAPIQLRPYHEQYLEESHLTYRLVPLDGPGLAWRVSAREPDSTWVHVYDLDLRPRTLDDFTDRCSYHQTSSASAFTQGTLCSKVLPDGRVTITKGRLIITRNGHREEHELGGQAAEWTAIREWFGIDLDHEGSMNGSVKDFSTAR